MRRPRGQIRLRDRPRHDRRNLPSSLIWPSDSARSPPLISGKPVASARCHMDRRRDWVMIQMLLAPLCSTIAEPAQNR